MKAFLVALLALSTQAQAAVSPWVFGADGKSTNLQTGISLPQSTTPSNDPVTGRDYLYFKSDDNLYILNHAGLETMVGSGGGGGSGTVTSVGLTAPAWLTVGGSPVTTSGTLALTGTSETQNLFLASPNGSSGALTPRAIVSADVPTLNQNTTGTAGNGDFYLSSSTGVYGGTNSTLTFTGVDNTVRGVSAGNAVGSGTDNTFEGYKAGILLTGSNNTIFGSKTALTSAAASDVLMVGYFTDVNSALTTDSNLIAIGDSMVLAHSSVTGDVLIGHGITQNAGSTNSVTIGASASDTATTGNNVTIGKSTGSTKSGCTVVGQGAACQGVDATAVGNSSAVTANFAVAYGYNTLASGSNALVIGASATTNKASNIVIGANLTGSAFASSIVLGTSTSGQLDPTTAANQLSIGTPDVPINDVYLGRGAKGDGTTPSGSVNVSATVGANIVGGPLTIRPGNGTGTGGSGAIIFQVAPVAGTSSTANTMATAWQISNKGGLNASTAQGTLTGSAGTAVCSQPFQGATYKKVICFLAGYTDTATLSYTYPTAFTNTPYVYGLSAGVTAASATTTAVTFTSTLLSGFVFMEGT